MGTRAETTFGRQGLDKRPHFIAAFCRVALPRGSRGQTDLRMGHRVPFRWTWLELRDKALWSLGLVGEDPDEEKALDPAGFAVGVRQELE